MPHWNMEYQVLYEDCRKSLEVKSEKIYGLSSVKKRYSANHHFTECQKEDTRQRVNSVCRPLTAAALCRVSGE